jgi:hypothetical protein
LFSRGIIIGGTTAYNIFNWWFSTLKGIFFKVLWWLQQFRGQLLTPKGKALPRVQGVKRVTLYSINTNFNIYYHTTEWMELTNVVRIHVNMGRVQGVLTMSLNTKA